MDAAYSISLQPLCHSCKFYHLNLMILSIMFFYGSLVYKCITTSPAVKCPLSTDLPLGKVRLSFQQEMYSEFVSQCHDLGSTPPSLKRTSFKEILGNFNLVRRESCPNYHIERKLREVVANTLSAVLNSPAPLLLPVSIPAIIAGFHFQFSLGTERSRPYGALQSRESR